MGTKNNPGEHDCYDKAHPDEPLFTLRAKDPLASDLVYLWMNLRRHNWVYATRNLAHLIEIALAHPKETRQDKLDEAGLCAVNMATWRTGQGESHKCASCGTVFLHDQGGPDNAVCVGCYERSLS